MAAASQAEDERAMLNRLWRQRVERARYAADRARRQYQLAEPENRLVTLQLESDWEAALAETARLEADYHRRHHRERRRGQLDRRRRHHLARRPPDHRPGRPARRAPGPAVVLPRPPRPRQRARRIRPQQQADRRHPQRRGIQAAQAHQPVHRRAGPRPDHPARHPRPAERPARRAREPAARPVVSSRPGRRAQHARPNRLHLDLPRLDHRPPRPWKPVLDHHSRQPADAGTARAQDAPARLLRPQALKPPRTATRQPARSAIMKKQRLTGIGGGQSRCSTVRVSY